MDRAAIDLFRDVADRSPAERDDYYARHKVPAALRAEVESLLRFDRESLDPIHGRVASAAAGALLDDFKAPHARPSSPTATDEGVNDGPSRGLRELNPRVVEPLARSASSLCEDPDDNTWDTVDGKLAEAEFFLQRMATARHDTFEFGCYLSAFLSAARTATLAMQRFSHAPGLDEGYQPHQERLKADSLAKFMLEARNEHWSSIATTS